MAAWDDPRSLLFQPRWTSTLPVSERRVLLSNGRANLLAKPFSKDLKAFLIILSKNTEQNQ
jgi:hypothetical protein